MNFRLIWMGPDDDPQNVPRLPSRATPHAAPNGFPPYAKQGNEIVHRQVLQNGRVKITAVANFQARIVRDLIFDDGEQARREFAIDALVDETRLAFSVSAAEFSRMDWVLSKLGPRAIIYPGQQQHARAAIQSLSGDIIQEHIFSHTGWRQQETRWVYLHAGGALGSDGPAANVRVQLPAALQAYRLKAPQDLDDRARAVSESLRFLRVAPDRITFPLLAGVHAAALGSRGFSLFLAGRSGVFKTALAALCQQHFGAAMDASRLPANFASTANALESLAFHTKDAILVADDFAPAGTQADRGLQRLAERLFRSAGNQQGRSRLSSSGRTSAARPPRAVVLGTGEEVPDGQSVRARLVILEVGMGDVNSTVLTDCQKAAQQGRFAISMGSFLAWVAGQYDPLQQSWRTRVGEIRSQGGGQAVHARLPAALAELQASFEIFLGFAVEIGAIGAVEQEHLAQRNVLALNQLIERQAKYHLASDPTTRFLTLLQTALRHGHPPTFPVEMGRPQRIQQPGDGAKPRLGPGFRRASESGGWPVQTYTWSLQAASKWPSRWPAASACQ